MSIELLQSILPFLTVLLMIMQLALFFVLFRALFARQNEDKPIDEILAHTKERSSSIIHRAFGQANKILVSAELEGIRQLSQEKRTGHELVEALEKHLKVVETTMQDHSSETARKAEESYKTFIKNTEQTIQAHIEKNDKFLTDRSTAMTTHAQEQLDAFIKDVHGKVSMEVEQALQAARNEIAEYKQRRIQVLDEKIIDVLERTLQVALEKKLSLVEQSELVYKALEEAKHENSFN